MFLGFAIPGYVVGIALLTFFASRLGWFPLGGFVSDNFEQLSAWDQICDVLHHGDAAALVVHGGKLRRHDVRDEELADGQPRPRTTCAPPSRKACRFAAPFSAMPFATASFRSRRRSAATLRVILAGSFLIERIYNIDGFGLLGYESLVARDYPVVLGILVHLVVAVLDRQHPLRHLRRARRPAREVRYLTCGASDCHRRPQAVAALSLDQARLLLAARNPGDSRRRAVRRAVGKQPRADREVRRRVSTFRRTAGIFPATRSGSTINTRRIIASWRRS